jgi:flagellar motor component MotA
MNRVLKETLVEHASGNIRVLNNMGAELLALGARKKTKQLDEKLFLEAFSRPPRK